MRAHRVLAAALCACLVVGGCSVPAGAPAPVSSASGSPVSLGTPTASSGGMASASAPGGTPTAPSSGTPTASTPAPTPTPQPAASGSNAILAAQPGVYSVKGLVLVNRKHGLPAGFAPPWASAQDGLAPDVTEALHAMVADAAKRGITLKVFSGYRSIALQTKQYNEAVRKSGAASANRYWAPPRMSEHHTGLAIDLTDAQGRRGDAFLYTPQARYLAANAYRFGFIIRYPKGKTAITGYAWEPWHVRYVGVAAASEITQRGLTLEQYLGDR